MPAFEMHTEHGQTARVELPSGTAVVTEQQILDAVFSAREQLQLEADFVTDLEVYHGHKREGDQYALRGEKVGVEMRDYNDHLVVVHVTLQA